jgi:hypothetical protein
MNNKPKYEIERLRSINAELLAALKRMASEYGRQNEDALDQAEGQQSPRPRASEHKRIAIYFGRADLDCQGDLDCLGCLVGLCLGCLVDLAPDCLDWREPPPLAELLPPEQPPLEPPQLELPAQPPLALLAELPLALPAHSPLAGLLKVPPI